MQEINDLFCNIQRTPGLYGLYSIPGLGKRELLMYICQMLVKRTQAHPLIFSLELSDEQWKKNMLEYGFGTEGIVVEDSAWEIDDMRQCIEKHLPTIVFVDDLKLIETPDVINKLKGISTDYSISVIVTANLARNSGDSDPVYRRPQLFDLIYTCDNKKTIGEFKNDLYQFTTVMLLHRNHDWYRSIGVGRAFHICNEAELKIVCGVNMRPQTIYFDFSHFIHGLSEWESE
jgi:hypothetical protein